MIQYQLTVDGCPLGKPKPEWEVDKLLKNKPYVTNELGKVIVRPELKVVK